MIITISNEVLAVKIDTLGAEIKSIVKDGTEYIWSGDPKYWSGTSPVLFPMVSSFLDNKYTYNGKTYNCEQHGFAWASEFGVIEKTESSVLLRLEQTEYTRERYPFEFDFCVSFVLDGNRLKSDFIVKNMSKTEKMYFNTGSHEGFSLFNGGKIEDYYVEFEKKEKLVRMVLDRPVYEGKTVDFGESEVFEFSDSLFEVDGVFFGGIESDYVTFKSKNGDRSVRVYFDCSNLGFWKVQEADYLCIEPWDGFCPFAGDGYEISEKRFIKDLEPESEYKFYHCIEVN